MRRTRQRRRHDHINSYQLVSKSWPRRMRLCLSRLLAQSQYKLAIPLCYTIFRSESSFVVSLPIRNSPVRIGSQSNSQILSELTIPYARSDSIVTMGSENRLCHDASPLMQQWVQTRICCVIVGSNSELLLDIIFVNWSRGREVA